MTNEKYYTQFLANNPNPRQLKSYDLNPNHLGIYLEKNGKKLINFSSNDYLGLSKHPLLIEKAHHYSCLYGMSSSSSRSVTGNFFLYEKLEADLAKAIGKPSALILGSGYQTNISVLEALLDTTILKQEPLVFCDRLCHTSLLTGARYFTRIHRFQHNNLQHLQDLLEKYSHSERPKFILAESIYSMDGDQANLFELTRLAKQYEALLYIDDAHAIGVYGPLGWGKAAEYNNEIDIIMGTFSKALGSYGGYIACSLTMRNYLINRCKGLIYATGLSPAVLGAIAASIELIPQLENERQKLLAHGNKLRDFFKIHGLDCGQSSTHIIPWVIGDGKKTLRASELLEEGGILGAAIRPPSVPLGQSRIRFCLSAAHTSDDLEQLMDTIQKVERKL